MIATIINDCRDDNAKVRQQARAAVLFGCPVSFIGVESDLEAAGNLVDVIDAIKGREGIVLVNVAPRNGKARSTSSDQAKNWNGTPFGYFWYKKTLVVSTVDGVTLSLVKKLQIADEIRLLECNIDSQFRSYEFLPRVAKEIFEGKHRSYKVMGIDDIADAPKAVWWVDNFGNCKTTLLPSEIDFHAGGVLRIKGKNIQMFQGLKDVPDKSPGVVIGSSGIEEKRFLEIVVQGGSTAQDFSLRSGDVIL